MSLRSMRYSRRLARAALVSVVAVLVCAPIIGADGLPALNDLKVPSNPAMTLLGSSQTEIDRPGTPSDLAITLLSDTKNLSEIPTDFALEVSPFWIIPQPRLSWRSDVERDPLKSVARTLSVSLATAELGDSTMTTSAVSLAVRTSIFSGRMSDSSVAKMERLETALGSRAEQLLRLHEEWLRANGKILVVTADSINAWIAAAEGGYDPARASAEWDPVRNLLRSHQSDGSLVSPESLIESIEHIRDSLGVGTDLVEDKRVNIVLVSLRKYWRETLAGVDEDQTSTFDSLLAIWNDSLTADTAAALKDFEIERTGIKWEIAGGVIAGFQDRTAAKGKVRGGAIWTTFAFPNVMSTGAELLITGRWINNELLPKDDHAVDAGARAVFQTGKYTFSYEFVGRYYPDYDADEWDYRHGLLIEAEISPGKSISLTLGEDFDREAANSFLAKLGLNIGIRNLGLGE